MKTFLRANFVLPAICRPLVESDALRQAAWLADLAPRRSPHFIISVSGRSAALQSAALLLMALGALPALQAQSYANPYGVITLAGAAGSAGSTDSVGSAARFSGPSDVAIDAAGNLYIADAGNNTIRKITLTAVYYDPIGTVTTFAGQPGVSGSNDGTGAASFNHPAGLAVDSAGNVYVADTNNDVIRKVTAAGFVSTLAGVAGRIGSADGSGSAASFNGPSGIIADATGNLYVADTLNHTIRRVTPVGVVTTIAGAAGVSGFLDAVGTVARFHGPQGLALDSSGNLFVADTNNNAVRKINTATAAVTTVAGAQAGTAGSADGIGSQAKFYYPSGIAVDSSGNLYVADTDNHTLRMITSSGVVSTLAGLASSGSSADGVGTAARFKFPTGLAVSGTGNVFVADTDNNTIRLAYQQGIPQITLQPQGQSVSVGGSATFTATATGGPVLNYEWLYITHEGRWTLPVANGGATGMNTNTLKLNNIQNSDAGDYFIRVSNGLGTAISNTASLFVNGTTDQGGSPSPSSGGGGGGGGAPSLWFYGALSLLSLARWMRLPRTR